MRWQASISLSLLLGLVLGAGTALAQTRPDTVSALPEAAFEEIDERGDALQLAELLADLTAHPLDLNTADAEALSQIPALGPAQAQAIVRYRAEQGPFLSLSALAAVPDLSAETVRDAAPYLQLGAPSPATPPLLAGLRLDGLHRVGRRLELGRGYNADAPRYAGSPYRLYTRLRLRAARLRAALTLEKDPGEAFVWDPSGRTYGFDHVTAHVALHDVGPVTTLILGDYVATVGQGLVFWRGTAFGKSRSPVRPLVRAGRGLLPYASTDENRFLRGLAVTFRLRQGLRASLFASRRRLDARLLSADTTAVSAFADRPEAVSLAQTGLHRTATERAQKDAVRETLLGGVVAIRTGRFEGGIAGYRSRFAPPFGAGTAPHERFRFDRAQATLLGAYGAASLGPVYLFGEAARSDQGTVAGLAGLHLRMPRDTEAVLLARHYPPAFVSLHGYGFGERNGTTQNETGLYAGFALPIGPRWHLAAYFDLYRYPWLRFGVPRPSSGYEARLVLEYRPRRWLSAYGQARTETREVGTAYPDGAGRLLDGLQRETRQSLRFHADYRFGPRLRLRVRLEGVRFVAGAAPARFGLLIYQDVRWHPAARLRLDARLALFDTNAFGARVFAYEDDLRYSFAVPAFSGRGQRAYVVLRWDFASRLSLEAKAATTRFEDVREVGSGLEAVPGARLREVRAQIIWRL